MLSVEQKQTDFRPDEFGSNQFINANTNACTRVIRLINHLIEEITKTFDGKNLNSVLKELGLKFHRCLFDHLTQYQYSELGKSNERG